MTLYRCDDLGQFLHVLGLDVHHVETRVAVVELPIVYPQIVRADESLSVAVERQRVDVVGVRIGKGALGLRVQQVDLRHAIVHCWQ